jgi:hypothetical protein
MSDKLEIVIGTEPRTLRSKKKRWSVDLRWRRGESFGDRWMETCDTQAEAEALVVEWREALGAINGQLTQIAEAKWCTVHNDVAYTDEPVAPEFCSGFNTLVRCQLVPLFRRSSVSEFNPQGSAK